MRTEGRGKSIGVAAGRHRPLAVIDLMLFLLALMSACYALNVNFAGA